MVRRTRHNVTLPTGLAEDIVRMLGGRGLSKLITTLLLKWKEGQK